MSLEKNFPVFYLLFLVAKKYSINSIYNIVGYIKTFITKELHCFKGL